ncbi:MAG: hypothetical protein FJX72_10690 [Armatimonadetes bacterium]|nr:hypothetical protein [Armatimonadota bacterium]
MRDLTTGHRFIYVARRVLTSPVSILVWLGSVAASATLDWSPIPIAAAVGVQAALLVWRLNDTGYLTQLFADREQRVSTMADTEIEASLEQMDFETRQRIRYVVQLQKEIGREARAGDVEPYARAEFDRIASRLPGLVQQAIRIASRKQHLAKYLQHVDERALGAYADNLRSRIEATSDPVSRAQYEQALKARETELGTYRAIAQASGRIDSQLENVEATFASWKAKVIRLKTVDIGNVASFSEGLVNELDSLGREIELLDSSVIEALSPEQPVAAPQSIGGGP